MSNEPREPSATWPPVAITCSACGGSGRIVMGRPHPTIPGRSAWPLDDPICPSCRGEGRSPEITCPSVRVTVRAKRDP